jgi:glyoxylase-like metal-dependent hydrolase (beta-lactamase superfamily II)
VVSTPFADLVDGQMLDLADLSFTVVHTPGHTPGHCCFHLAGAGVLFSGDHLFAGSIGRTDLPGGSYETLMRSMADKILPLDESTDVLPGHGSTTTLARELATNPFLQELI